MIELHGELARLAVADPKAARSPIGRHMDLVSCIRLHREPMPSIHRRHCRTSSEIGSFSESAL